jgi:hypothetical protein
MGRWSSAMRKWIEDLRCPNIKGLPEDVVDIVRMRRSIERTNKILELCMQAAAESCELLKRLRYHSL